MGVQSSKEGGSYEIIKAKEGILKKAGYQESEFEQIEEAVGKTVYTLNGEEENAEEQEYAININTGKFHLPDCASVQKANPDNITYWTCTREGLIEDGYFPCGECKP